MKITTIKDAENIIGSWAERYIKYPTDEQIHKAARALVDYLGGFTNSGIDFEYEDVADFDLDTALYD